jgi:hypothetical protein
MRARLEDEMRTAVPDVDLPKMARNPRGAVAGFVAGLATQGAADAKAEADAAGGEEAAGDQVTDAGIALPGDEIGGDDGDDTFTDDTFTDDTFTDDTYADSSVYADGPDGEQVWGESGWTSRHDAAVSAASSGSSYGGRDEIVSADDPSMN